MDTSSTAGTIFHGSHISLRLWFRAIWWVTSQKNGMSALGLQRILGLGSYETAWACLHKLRRAMVRPGREPLSGKIEVDEISVGGADRGSRASAWRTGELKAIVIAAVEVRGTAIGRVRLKQISNTLGTTLKDFVKEVTEPGSEIITDGWAGYNGLAETGYTHNATVLTGKGKQASKAVLPKINLVTALLKRWLLGSHHGRVSRKHLGYYLDEFVFRFNRRASTHRGQLFYRLIQQAAAIDPVPYKGLIK